MRIALQHQAVLSPEVRPVLRHFESLGYSTSDRHKRLVESLYKVGQSLTCCGGHIKGRRIIVLLTIAKL